MENLTSVSADNAQMNQEAERFGEKNLCDRREDSAFHFLELQEGEQRAT